jgi:hypothetical protein
VIQKNQDNQKQEEAGQLVVCFHDEPLNQIEQLLVNSLSCLVSSLNLVL